MQKASDILNNLDMTALTQSFQSACSDKEFKEFVYGLKIEEEILNIKYEPNGIGRLTISKAIIKTRRI